MATIRDRALIDQIIIKSGYYPGHEQSPLGRIVRIVEYITPEGETIWGVVYEAEIKMGLLHRYDTETQYIRDPRVIYASAGLKQTLAKLRQQMELPPERVIFTDLSTITVEKVCPVCDQPSKVEGIPASNFQTWKNGGYIQEELYMLSLADREILLSGTHDECFNRIFPPDEDEFDDISYTVGSTLPNGRKIDREAVEPNEDMGIEGDRDKDIVYDAYGVGWHLEPENN